MSDINVSWVNAMSIRTRLGFREYVEYIRNILTALITVHVQKPVYAGAFSFKVRGYIQAPRTIIEDIDSDFWDNHKLTKEFGPISEVSTQFSNILNMVYREDLRDDLYRHLELLGMSFLVTLTENDDGNAPRPLVRIRLYNTTGLSNFVQCLTRTLGQSCQSGYEYELSMCPTQSCLEDRDKYYDVVALFGSAFVETLQKSEARYIQTGRISLPSKYQPE